MFLDKLRLMEGDVVRREIEFNRGVNLILETSVEDETSSGNSVGKTTALRAIDYCFGARPEIFFQDKEFKNDNKIVKQYFSNYDVRLELVLVDKEENTTTLLRNIPIDQKQYFFIDDEKFNSVSAYTHAIKAKFFASTSEKPSLRQILSRFIRSDNDRMTNALNTLHKSTPALEYETLDLFLFGFGSADLLTTKQKLKKQIAKLKKKKTLLAQDVKIGALKQSLLVIEKDIEEKEESKSNFRLSEAYDEEASKLEALKGLIAQKSIEISILSTQLSLTQSSVEKLEKSKHDIDTNELALIYKEAEARIGDVAKTFEESLNFHNQMIQRKIEFMSKEIPVLSKIIEVATKERDGLLKSEGQILSDITNTGSLADLEVLNSSLNALHEKKGKIVQAIDQIEDNESHLSSVEGELSKVSERLKTREEAFNKKLNKFNEFFSKYTKGLYGEEYVLYLAPDKKENIRFLFAPVGEPGESANPGEGTKKALVTAFDFAFLSYMKHFDVNSLRFAAHDGIEAIHENQVAALFQMAQKIGGQYVVSTLRKTVNFLPDEYVEKCKILELSENKKFFLIEERAEQPIPRTQDAVQ